MEGVGGSDHQGVREGDAERSDGHQEEGRDPNHLDCNPLHDVEASTGKCTVTEYSIRFVSRSLRFSSFITLTNWSIPTSPIAALPCHVEGLGYKMMSHGAPDEDDEGGR